MQVPSPLHHAARDLVLLLTVAAGLYLVYPSWAPLLDEDEPRYAAAARTMLETGDYVVPRFNGEPRLQKPPLVYWAMAAAIRLTGDSEQAARLPSALAGLATLAVLYSLVSGVAGRRAAVIAASTYATLPLVLPWARAASTDCLFTLFVSSAIFSAWRATEGSQDAKRRWYLLAVFAASLAILTKGPIGLLIPATVVSVYAWRQGTLRRELRAFPWAGGLAVALIVVAPWYVAMYIREGAAFYERFILQEHLARLVAGTGGPKNVPLWARFSLPYMPLVGLFPWSPFVLRELIRPFVKHGAVPGDVRRLRCLAAVWFWTVWIAFSLSRGQWPSYLQPLAPAGAILIGLSLDHAVCHPPQRTPVASLTLLAVLSGLVAAGLFAVPMLARSAPLSDPATAPWSAIVLWPRVCAVGTLAAACAAIDQWRRGDIARAAVVLSLGWAASFGVLVLGSMPPLLRYLSCPTAGAGVVAAELARDRPALVWGPRHATVVYYGHRDFGWYAKDDDRFRSALAAELSAGLDAVVITDATGARELERSYGAREVSSHGDVRVAIVPSSGAAELEPRPDSNSAAAASQLVRILSASSR